MSLHLLGLKFNHLTVLSKACPDKHGMIQWLCKCDCGTELVLNGSSLKRGRPKSCGCMTAEYNRAHATKYNPHSTLIHQTWSAMLQRCYNIKNPNYPNYGGRGIAVCEFIRSDPAHLSSLIGERKNTLQTLERTVNALHYSCGQCAECATNGWTLNVRWATRAEQVRNTRRNVQITFQGKTQCATDWANELGVHRNTLLYRYRTHGRLLG